MKLLHLLYSGLGGHGNVFFSMIEADKNKVFEYEPVFTGIEEIREEYISKCNFSNMPWKFIRKKRGIDLRFNWKIITEIIQSDSPVIFLHGSRFIVPAKIAALLSRKKKKIVVRETQANHLKTHTDWLWLILAMILAHRIIFLTDSFNEEIKKKLSWIYNPGKIRIIGNGLDLQKFYPSIKQAGNSIVLGMQSRIVSIKDHITLLQAFELLHKQFPKLEMQLIIAGDGESLASLRNYADRLSSRNKINFTGSLNEIKLVRFLQSLDIYIHASLGETMSTSIMQAMACKLPVVASDVPGINNMILHEQTGVLVPAKNQHALAQAIHNLVINPAKAKTLREAAFKFAQSNYSNKTMFAKYQDVFGIIQ